MKKSLVILGRVAMMIHKLEKGNVEMCKIYEIYWYCLEHSALGCNKSAFFVLRYLVKTMDVGTDKSDDTVVCF